MNVLDIRKQWMRLMGLDEFEIEQKCIENPPIDLQEEIKQLKAMFAIQALNEAKEK